MSSKRGELIDGYLRLAEERSRKQPRGQDFGWLPFSALRERHWTEAVGKSVVGLRNVFLRIPRGNDWAIPVHNARGRALGIVRRAEHQILLIDPGWCIDEAGCDVYSY